MKNTPANREYIRRINRAQDYIEKHLGERLTLAEIADAACFSPYHFHRLYTAITGESLHAFIQRVRLERAASLLLRHPNLSITEIALSCGFGSPATFARAFRATSGCTASEYRKRCQAERKAGKDGTHHRPYSAGLPLTPQTRRTAMPQSSPQLHVKAQAIGVRTLPARSLAYIRHVGPYESNCELFAGLFNEVILWADPRGLLLPERQAEFITVYHDNPEITAANKLRISLGITAPAGTTTGGRISLLEIPGGHYVCATFEIAAEEFADAWRAVCAEWLPQSGWQPSEHGVCHESYLNDPKTHPLGKHLVEIRIPVKPL